MRRLGKWLLITVATLFALVLIAIAAFFAVFDVDLGNGVGDRDVAITSVENLPSNYDLGIGTLGLDLRQLKVPVGETHISANVDVGDLRVLTPAGVALRRTAPPSSARSISPTASAGTVATSRATSSRRGSVSS